MTDRPADAATPHPVLPQQRAGDDVLARALSRARWTIFWERLWPALASIATVIGLFLAVSWLGLWLWLPPIGRAIGLGVFFLLAAAAFAPLLMLRVPSRMEGLRRLDRNSGLPHRPATAMADEIAAPTEDSFSLALWRAHVERALRAAKTLKAGTPMPRLARARSVRAARPRGGAGGRDVLRRRRRADEARRRRLRLAGRDRAGQFPHRCLGEPADLYRQAAGDPAGPAAGRAGADRRRAVGAGGQHAGHPRQRNSPRRDDERRACRARLRRAQQQRQGYRGAPLRDQRCAAQRPCAAPPRATSPGSSPPSRTSRRPSRSPRIRRPGARRAAALLQARGRLRRRRRAGDVQAAEQRRHQRPSAASALRRARFPAGAAAGAHQERRRDRPPRI